MPTGLPGETWPSCEHCGRAFSFVAQINTERDAAQPGTGFFSFFYCWECSPYGRKPNKETGQWRIVQHPTLALAEAQPLAPPAPGDGRLEFEARFARGHPERSAPCGVEVAVHCERLWERIPGKSGSAEAWKNWRLVTEVADELCGGSAPKRAKHLLNRGVVIGGYPCWANGPDLTPRCECGALMQLLLQIGPSDLTDANWGDVGTLYLFCCAQHRESHGLRMQCT